MGDGWLRKRSVCEAAYVNQGILHSYIGHGFASRAQESVDRIGVSGSGLDASHLKGPHPGSGYGVVWFNHG